MSDPGGGGAWRIKGRRERPRVRGMVRCAMASMGRCFLMGGLGTAVRQSRGRYTEERPLVRWREESWALNTEREEKVAGSLAAAGLCVGVRGWGTGYTKCRKASSVPAVCLYWWETHLPGKDGGGSRVETVDDPSAHPVRE